MDTCTWPRVMLACLLVLLAQTVLGQTPIQSPESVMEFDCRRPGVSCGNSSNENLCLPNGTCDCSSTGRSGYDCTLDESKVLSICTTCYNGATCLTDGSCYCSAGYYGKQCENKRAELWCDGQEMTINIFPIGSAGYHIFVTTQGKDNSNNSACNLTEITDPANYSSISYVKNTIVNAVPQLQGFIIRLNHTDSTGTLCGSANKTEDVNVSRTDYIRKVVLEYNAAIISSLDHLITLNCSMQNYTNFTTSSDSAAVSIAEDDYTPVDVVTTFQPVIFEVMDAENKPLSTSVTLGQDIKLVFTLADNSNYTSFKVASCFAANGNTNSSLKFSLIDNDCPTTQSKLVSLGEAQRSTVPGASGNLKKVIIPLKAFKFKGIIDQVIFSCTCTMCRNGDDTACNERTCGAAPATPAPSTTTTTTQQTTEANTTEPSAGRRKRAASQQDQQEVSSTIRVTSSSTSTSGSSSSSGQDSQTVAEEECMDRTQVITIIVVFSVIVLLLLVVVVALVVSIYRSRLRIASKVGILESTSLYSLPRLTVAHDKPA
ncbi:EGF-like domain-containing protein 2 isoform X2 [Pomacea canaliculata]|nr:EGF-like domain-containing protein 2 isoform X2 [Pomacea canaliculata]XP_025083406.1 EGF-like domain-containing protein 2 isoform X2 [Pomacea canaliculata]